MAAWFQFALDALHQIVLMVFNLDLGLGFSLGDFEVALLLIGIVASALVIKFGSFASSEVMSAKRISEKSHRN